MNFNEYINQRRKQLNMSVDDLVEKSGIPKGTLSKITAGINTNPTLSTIEAICRALNCTIDEAITSSDKNTKSEELISDKKEICILKKYRNLDDYGKKAVDSILDVEYERVTATKQIKIAARNGDNKTISMTTDEEQTLYNRLNSLPAVDDLE